MVPARRRRKCARPLPVVPLSSAENCAGLIAVLSAGSAWKVSVDHGHGSPMRDLLHRPVGLGTRVLAWATAPWRVTTGAQSLSWYLHGFWLRPLGARAPLHAWRSPEVSASATSPIIRSTQASVGRLGSAVAARPSELFCFLAGLAGHARYQNHSSLLQSMRRLRLMAVRIAAPAAGALSSRLTCDQQADQEEG